MNVKPKFVYYDIRRMNPVNLISYTHENDVDTQVLEVNMLNDGEQILLDKSYTYTAAIVNRDTKALINDNISCELNDSGNVLIPIDNLHTRGEMNLLIELTINDSAGNQVLVTPFPLWIHVNASILDDAQVTPESQDTALVLWDWEGAKLAEYSRQKALALSALPAPSTLPPYAYTDHDLLVFQEWNWGLANIKAWIQAHEGRTLDVGAIYTTTDGQDHNYWGNPRLDTKFTINMQKRATASIGNYAFSGCYSLAQINIPDSVTSIRNYAFSNCFSLTSINIPNSVTSIENDAFLNCYSLTQINIPDSVTSIGDRAFQYCYSLTKINIPDGVTSIGDGAFSNCFSLTSINIPNSVTSIENDAFLNCYSLTQINIPDSVTSIGNYAFSNCCSLCDVLLESKPTLTNTNAFSGLLTNYRIYVPRSYLSWFETATNWSSIYTAHIVAIEDYINYLESLGFDVDKYKEVTA